VSKKMLRYPLPKGPRRDPYVPLEIRVPEDDFNAIGAGSVAVNPTGGKAEARPTRRRRIDFMAPGESYSHLIVKVAIVRPEGVAVPHKLDSAGDVAVLLASMQYEAQEVFVVLLMDAKNQCVGVYEAHRGTLSSVEVHPAVIFRPALVMGAISIIVAHNHPSGSTKESLQDRVLTKRLQSAGGVLGVPLLDHVIIAGNTFTSAARDGWL
jgi:DNA repair protein RadC